MSTQPNWAQQAAAQSQKPGMNKNVMWGIIGGAILLVIAIVIAMTTTSSTTPATGKSVNVSKSVSIQGEALQKAENSTGVIDPTTDTAVGSSAPTFTASQIDGRSYTYEPGRPTLFVFIAHWCPHCQAEVPRMVEWDGKGLIPDTIDVVAVSTSASKSENNFPPSDWLTKEKWTRPAVADSAASEIAAAYGVSGFPYFVAVDGGGKVVQRGSGELTEIQFTDLITKIAPK